MHKRPLYNHGSYVAQQIEHVNVATYINFVVTWSGELLYIQTICDQHNINMVHYYEEFG